MAFSAKTAAARPRYMTGDSSTGSCPTVAYEFIASCGAMLMNPTGIDNFPAAADAFFACILSLSL